MVEVERKQRVDAGIIRETARDTAALQWITEQYAAPLDIVEQLLGVSRIRVYQLVQRWREAGWVHTGKPEPGAMWVWPTSATARRMLGRENGLEWAPRPATAAHVRAVAAVRLHWGALTSEQWTSERELRQQTGYRQRGERVGHISDGVFIDSDGRDWAVEVEITPKGSARTDKHVMDACGAAAAASLHGVRYVVTRAAEADVRAAMAKVPGTRSQQGRLLVERIEDIPGWRWQQ